MITHRIGPLGLGRIVIIRSPNFSKLFKMTAAGGLPHLPTADLRGKDVHGEEACLSHALHELVRREEEASEGRGDVPDHRVGLRACLRQNVHWRLVTPREAEKERERGGDFSSVP